jgi:hypothetical protein
MRGLHALLTTERAAWRLRLNHAKQARLSLRRMRFSVSRDQPLV